MMTEQDDEGYTSPSKDGEAVEQNGDMVHVPPGMCRKQRRPASSADLSSARCSVAWEKIAALPDVAPPRHISWDDVKHPFPYKSSNYSSAVRNRINLESKVFVSDEVWSSAAIVDKAWMIRFGNGGERHASRAVLDFISQKLTPTYITMKQFIDQALHLMCGRESKSFCLRKPGADVGSKGDMADFELLFKNNTSVIVQGISPSALNNFCQPFLECGSAYKRLSRVSSTEERNSRTRRSSIACIQQFSRKNAIFQSFSTFISNYLKLYETVIMVKKDSVRTMTQLRALMNPLRCQLRALEQIVESQVDGNVVELLTALNDLLFSVENQVVVNMIKNLFISCASAYLRYIADWIFRGELGSSNEFHIARNPKVYEGRRFWTKQFIQKDMVPVFLKESVEKIFETGKALNLLITLQPVLYSVKMSSMLVGSIEEEIRAELGFEQLKSLGETWALKLDSFYSENSHLVTEIQDAVLEVICNTSKSLDTDKFAAERANFHRRMEQRRLEAFQQDKAKKQDLMQSLQKQIKLSNEIRIQRRMEERLEDKKIQEYYAALDKANAEGIKGFARNYFPRSASGLDTCDGVMSRDRMAIPPSKSEPGSIADYCAGGNGKHLQADQRPEGESILAMGGGENAGTLRASDRKEPEKEVRFNPDKIITRDPQPYAFSPLSDFAIPIVSPKRAVDTERRRNQAKYNQFCMNEFLSCSISIPLAAQNKMVNALLLHHIIIENKLFQHLVMIHNYLCLQNGVFSHFLSELLIDEVKKSSLRSSRDLYEKSYRINTILGEALSIALENEVADPLLKNINFTFAGDLKTVETDQPESCPKASSKFQSLNHLRLTYAVDWPINIILTDEMMTLYENIFSFLMKLIRAELLLERMFCHLKSKRSKSRQLFQLNTFRFRMLHFVRSVRNYANITVIHTAWNELCSKLHEMDSVEKIYLHLVAHVKNVTSNCLLGQKAEKIMKLILRHLLVVESFCCQLDTIINSSTDKGIRWDEGEEIPKAQFVELSQKYEVSEQYANLFTESVLKVSTRRAYNKVDNFFEHYNFNGFFHAF